MKAFLLFSSNAKGMHMQSLLEAQGYSTQIIENQSFTKKIQADFQASILITDDQEIHKKLNFNVLNHSKVLLIATDSKTTAVNCMEMLQEVDGIIHEDFSEDILIQAVQEISKGMAFICPRVASSFKNYFQHQKNRINNLSEKELEVVKLLVKGDRYANIADALGMSINTVRFHIKNIYKKHNIHNKTVLSRYFHDLVYNQLESIKPIYTEV